MTFPLLRTSARRETISPAGIARFLGLAALGGRLQRTLFFRTRERQLHTAVGTVGVAAAIGLVALLIPASRPPLAAILHAPGNVIGAIVGGSSDDQTVKGYPRLYSTRLDIDHYQITEIHADVRWNDLEWLQPSKDNRLTLQTCNYSGDYDPRFVVVAKLISSDLGARLAGA